MLDHVTLHVTRFDEALAAYRTALAPLGYRVIMDLSQSDVPDLPAARMAGLGTGDQSDLWLRKADGPVTPMHLAFRADDRRTVDAFYAAAFTAGMKDNGPPGLRKAYHPDYYGAFVLDGDGHNIEAVSHQRE